MNGATGLPRTPISRRGLLSAGAGLTAAAVLAACSPAPEPPASGGPRQPAARIDPGPVYRASNGFLYAPDGSLFTPVGANVGTTGTFDWKGDSRGHAADAVAWGWNTVRLNLMVTAAHSWSFVAQRGMDDLLALVDQMVREYTDAGIVVILSAHDDPRAEGVDRRAAEAGLAAWWTLAATRFAGNPRVWYGLLNEPDYTNDEWVALMDGLAAAVRGTGNTSPVLLGASCWGQDVAGTRPYFADARFGFEASMAPAIAARHENVIFEQHNYGAYGLYASKEKWGAYLEKVRDAGLTPLIGEFGYTVAKKDSPDIYDANYDAAQAVFELAAERHVGALWWHGTHGDNYSVMADGGPFWKGRDGAGLSDGGRRLWQFGHGGR